MKVLLISPNPKTESGGIAQWTGHLLSYYKGVVNKEHLQLVHCCYEKSVSTFASDKIVTRIYKALHNYIPICKRLKKELKHNDIDVVHICSSGSLSFFLNYYMISTCHRFRAKVVMHYRFGRIPQLITGQGWESRMFERVFHKANYNIVLDKKTYDALIENGYNNVCMLPNPLSPEISRMAKSLKLGRSSKKVLFVGHVVPTKGIYELINACKQINGLELELIGYVSNAIRNELYKISGPGSQKWLKIVGIKDIDYIIKAMLQTSVFVLPTYSEGFPNVILESMACACPIVTTPVGAIPEMLDIKGSFPCGLCVPPQEVEPLKEAILYFIDNREEALMYGRRAQERVENLYSMEIVWKELLSIWDNCI